MYPRLNSVIFRLCAILLLVEIVFIVIPNKLVQANDPNTYIISGNTGAGGTILSYTDGLKKTATSAADGNYSFMVSSNWSGTVTPSETGYTFLPASIT